MRHLGAKAFVSALESKCSLEIRAMDCLTGLPKVEVEEGLKRDFKLNRNFDYPSAKLGRSEGTQKIS